MEAPKTIFVNYLGFGCFDKPYTDKMFASQIEYIRKDAFYIIGYIVRLKN